MASGAIAAHVLTSDDLAARTTYNFFHTMETTDGKWIFTSATKTMAMQKSSTSQITFGSSGSWAAASEPTSGILLFLGVAGLALRRKQK